MVETLGSKTQQHRLSLAYEA